MTNSLRDQLLQAGLVTEDQVRNANKKKHGQRKQQPKKARKGPTEAQKLAAKQQRDKAARDRKLNEKREAEMAKKAAQAQIRELLEKHKLDHSKGETLFRYTLGDRVKQIHVTDEQHRLLVAGKLAITGLRARACLIPIDLVEKLRTLDAEKAVFVPTADSSETEEGYEGFEVPDDISW